VAIGATLLTAAYNNANATSYNTASISPAANSLLLVFVSDNIGTGSAPRSVPTGLSLTWQNLGYRMWGPTPGEQMSGLWIAQCGASPGSGAITFTENDMGSGTTSSGTGWIVIQVTGHHVAEPIRQIQYPGTGTTSNTSGWVATPSLSIPLLPAADANSRAFAFFAHPANEATTPRSGWTELSDTSGSSPNFAMESQWRSDAFETTASASWATQFRCFGMAVEIAEAAAESIARATIATYAETWSVLSSSVTVNMPIGITAGDLLIAYVAADANATVASGGGQGWTSIQDTSNGSAVRLKIFAKLAAGGDALTLTLGSAVDAAVYVHRITNHLVADVATDILPGTAATGTSLSPNPPSVTPPSSRQWMVIACAAADDDNGQVDLTYQPSGYVPLAQTESSETTTSAMMLVACQLRTTSSAIDPGAFAMTSSEEWVAQTLLLEAPYAGLVPVTPLPGVDPDVEVGVGVEWDGVEFSEITADLREMTIRLPSRSRLQAVFQAGSATLVLDNRLRTYDPLYAAGPNFGDLKANRRVRITLNVAGGTPTVIFNGWTDGWSFAYDKSNNDATATITCIDALAKAGFSAIPAGTTPTLAAGEYVATRGDAVVTVAGSTGITYSAASGYARFGTTWDATVQHNLLTELRRCAELEVAPLLALDTGVLYQEARYWFSTRVSSATSNATIPSATLPCNDIRVVYDARELVSAVSMTDETGIVATATNAAAVSDFGERYADLKFDGMPAADRSTLQGAANTWVGIRGGEEMRFDTVTILPQRSEDWWPHIQYRRPLDRVTVSLTPTDVGDPITQDAFIDGIEHHITLDSWVTQWHLLPADLFTLVEFFIIGTDVIDSSTKLIGY
jgi:hypothetical protein